MVGSIEQKGFSVRGFARWLFGVAFVCSLLAGGVNADEAGAADAEGQRTAAAILQACTVNLPREKMVLTGVLAVRRQRGFILSENPYRLELEWGASPPALK